MRICSCENPIYVLSPHTGEIIRSSCGTCNSCRNQRAKNWIDRLDTETKQHKYCYMVTLTYDDVSLPKLMFSEDLDYLEFVNRDAERIPLQELIDLCKDEYGEYLEEDLNYLRRRLIHPLGLPCIFTKDISDLFKRMNRYTNYHITNHYENYRYFCCHEYGPTSFRIHSHLLIWFDDDRIERHFKEILSSCWTLGFCDADAVYSHGGRSYVAQYVNMSCHLPAFYNHSKMRPKSQFSKCPSIGSFNLLDEEIRNIYERIPTKRSVWDSSSAKYVTLPIQSSFSSRFFPKLQGYRDLSHIDRVTLYGCCSAVPSSNFEEFKDSVIRCAWLRLRKISNYRETIIADYTDKLSLSAPDQDSFRNSLYRWYSVSKRLLWFSYSLGVSMNYIVSRIDEFWKKLNYENLKSFYEWQQSYVLVHPIQDLVCAYPQFYHMYKRYIRGSDFGHLTQTEKYALESFNILDDSDFPDLNQTYDFKEMKLTSLRIYKDTHKAQSINNYLYSKRFRDSDPKLQSIIQNYKKWQKEI